MKSINERIEEIKTYYFGKDRGNHKKFSDKIGVASNTASNWMKDGYSIGVNVIIQLLEAFPDVNANWLITGSGEITITKSSNSDSASLQREIEKLKNELKELSKENYMLQGENKVLREQIGLGERKKDRSA
ncbi:hypothetical protein [uncultured Bacteroides sp.]|uniref:hypothetical protein n=1 Tax=uncultured Bacteroides sp. TaxID=162156 RepID=UPI002AA6B131|nr:hypothetical protein [uncultured Bacteroides sp.]